MDASQIADFINERLSVITQIDSFTGVCLGYSETRKLLILLREENTKGNYSSFEPRDIDLLLECHDIDPSELKAELWSLIDERQWPTFQSNTASPFDAMQVFYRMKISALQVEALCNILDWPSKFKIPNP